MRVLVDTNVLLDFFLNRQPFFQSAQSIFTKQKTGIFTGYITSITVVNLYYIAKKILGDSQARLIIQSTLSVFLVIPSNHALLSTALLLSIADYEDAVQANSALVVKLDAIVTRDLKDYKNSPVPVYDPISFLEML